MSASTEKATRRDIRRAFGQDALNAISERDQTIQEVSTNLQTLDHWTQRALADTASLFSGHDGRIQALEDRPYPLSLWERLRWLATGA